MIRVAHVINGLGTGGAEVMLANLLERTDRKQFDPVVIALSDLAGPVAARIGGLGVRSIHLGMSRLPGPFSFLRLQRAVRSIEPDVLQGWMYHGNLAALAAAGASRRRVPVLWNIRASNADLSLEKTTTAAVIRLSALLSGRPVRIISNSTASARLHGRDLGFRTDRWEIIPNGFDTARFAPSGDARREIRAEAGVGGETLLIGLIGRYHEVKDHSGFLRAAALLAAPAVLFFMAGKGVDRDNRHLARDIQALGLEGRVRLLGERTDMPRLAAALDIATCSSSSEGFPAAIGEAMSAGVPAVVTDVGDAGWLVSDTGIVVPPRRPEMLAAAWRELIAAGPEKRQALGAAARRRIEQHFTIESVVDRYENLYQSVAGGIEKGATRPCAA